MSFETGYDKELRTKALLIPRVTIVIPGETVPDESTELMEVESLEYFIGEMSFALVENLCAHRSISWGQGMMNIITSHQAESVIF